MLGLAAYRDATWPWLLTWSLLVGGSLLIELRQERSAIEESARIEVRANYQQIWSFRHWVAQHGGVYVPLTATTPANPYLAATPEREIETPSGRVLTLMNPAYVTRQILQTIERDTGVRGHLTSLKPIRPENAPDAWERAALRAFEQGVVEVDQLAEIDSKPYLRLMKPLLVEEVCLGCHAEQGYRVGDVRGGLTVSVPMIPHFKLMRQKIARQWGIHGAIWILGLVTLVFTRRMLRAERRGRDEAFELLKISEERFRTIAKAAPVGIFRTDPQGNCQYVNAAWQRITNTGAAEAVGTPWFGKAHRDDIARVEGHWQKAVQRRGSFRAQFRFQRSDGTDVWVLGLALPEGVTDGAALHYVGTLSDITDLKEQQHEVARLNLALRALGNNGRILVRARDESALFQETCDNLVENGGYVLAWIGLAMDDAEQSVKPVARAGPQASYLDNIKVSWGDNELGQGPTGKALRSGTPQYWRRVLEHPKFEPWRERAAQHGFRSSASLPILIEGRAKATLNVYAATADAFRAADASVLEELAEDLSYGINALRTKVESKKVRKTLETVLMQTVQSLAAMAEIRDPYTAGHQRRVADLSSAIAHDLGLPDEQIEGIRLGAILHDAGKISVPAEILMHPGVLSEPQVLIIKAHPQIGAEIISGIEFPWPVAEMVRQHHERLDGSGYPQGLKGAEIIQEARIIAVADVVESIATHRPYRPSRGLEAALAEIEAGRGTLFDPAVVDSCLRLFKEKRYNFG